MRKKTWKEEAIEVCELRDIEVMDEDDLKDVFIEYCDPISHIEKIQKEIKSLQSQIAELKSELEKERSVVDFYAHRSSWATSHFSPDYVSEVKAKIIDDLWNESDAFYFGGRLARQRQRERK